jgi:hypothetical protein
LRPTKSEVDFKASTFLPEGDKKALERTKKGAGGVPTPYITGF